jgi:hypothetical protein
MQPYKNTLLSYYIFTWAWWQLVSTSKVVEPSPSKTQLECPIHESMDMMHLSKHAQPHETFNPKLNNLLAISLIRCF